MKAIRIHDYGGPGKMVYEEAPKPVISSDEVLIKIYATALNPVDWKTREGYLKGIRSYHFPLILGWDVSGTIEEIGSGVKGFQIGDEVYSRPDITRNGSYAEYIAVKAAEVAYKPKEIDFVHAAAVPLAGLTAWQTLFEAGKLQAGQKVLILGASGGVGSFAVQFAKWKKAYVIGVASTKNQSLLYEIGADSVIDYKTTDYQNVVSDVDLVFDTIGENVRAAGWRVLKKGGILASITGKPDDGVPEAAGKTGIAVRVAPNARQLTEIGNLIDKGIVKPLVSQVFPLQEAANALTMLQNGQNSHGKIVLKVVD
jgi:NADPH:quinone reductase-like Zn-dependent oxidoreductase